MTVGSNAGAGASLLATILVLCAALTPTPAQAGFEWVTPTDGGQPVYNAAPGAGRQGMPTPDIISPVVITGDANSAGGGMVPQMATQPQTAYVQQQQQQQQTYPSPAYAANANGASSQPIPLSSGPASSQSYMAQSSASSSYAAAPAPAPAAMQAPADDGGGIVQGFASQIPLTLALRQILPVGTSFSIDRAVDANTLVSYKGGRSWRATLGDMLAPVGLVAIAQGSTIFVGPATAGQNAPQPMPMTAMAAGDGGGQPLPLSAGSQSQSMGAPLTVGMSASSAPMAGPDTSNGLNMTSADGWTAPRGDTLRKVLADWCHRSGVELQWLAEYDYPMEASAHFNGTFEEAVRGLLAGFENARPQPVGELHTNTTADQMLLVVQIRGNNYAN